MFKGNTTVLLNEATVKEALQEWFDERLTSDRRNVIKSVTQKVGTYGGDGFEVKLEEVVAVSAGIGDVQ
jgi:hypothetical protein